MRAAGEISCPQKKPMVGEDAQPDKPSVWKDFGGAGIPQTLGSGSGNLE